MTAHILLNLLYELRIRDQMRDLSRILSLFPNSFNKSYNKGARLLDYIYHMTLKLFCNHIFCMKMSRLCHIYATLLWASLNFNNVTKM